MEIIQKEIIMSRASKIVEDLSDLVSSTVRGSLGPSTELVSPKPDPVTNHADSVVDHVSSIVPAVKTAAEILPKVIPAVRTAAAFL